MLSVTEVVDDGLGNTSYLIDLGDGRALAVDPGRDPTPYLAHADRDGLQIAYTAETHLHADFVSGSRELAALGAVVLAPAEGGYGFDHEPMANGDELDLGGLTLRTISSPGHTPEHVSYVVLDGDRPLAAFTGGALLVGSVARTDLISPERTVELTRSAYRSARSLVAVLDDGVRVYPTHGAGSFCSLEASSDRTTTVGRELSSNQVFTSTDEDAFVDSFLAGLGTFPPYFLRLRAINQRGPRVFGPSPPALAPLSVEDVQRHVDAGAVVVDARAFEAFAAGHIPRSLSIELRPQFASWLGWLVGDDRPLVFVLSAGQDRSDIVRQCLNIGYENLAGELDGGMEAWHRSGAPSATTGLTSPDGLRGAIVDVRQAREAAEGRIPQAAHVELGELANAPLPPGPATLYCGHGQRAMTGASLLERDGRTDLHVLVGGPEEWSDATGRELERDG